MREKSTPMKKGGGETKKGGGGDDILGRETQFEICVVGWWWCRVGVRLGTSRAGHWREPIPIKRGGETTFWGERTKSRLLCSVVVCCVPRPSPCRVILKMCNRAAALACADLNYCSQAKRTFLLACSVCDVCANQGFSSLLPSPSSLLYFFHRSRTCPRFPMPPAASVEATANDEEIDVITLGVASVVVDVEGGAYRESGKCIGTTDKGAPCNRSVKNGGLCYQHRPRTAEEVAARRHPFYAAAATPPYAAFVASLRVERGLSFAAYVDIHGGGGATAAAEVEQRLVARERREGPDSGGGGGATVVLPPFVIGTLLAAMGGNTDCPVCLVDLKTLSIHGAWCGHLICQGCYVQLQGSKKCPSCRERI